MPWEKIRLWRYLIQTLGHRLCWPVNSRGHLRVCSRFLSSTGAQRGRVPVTCHTAAKWQGQDVRQVCPSRLFPAPRPLCDQRFHIELAWTPVLTTYNGMLGSLVQAGYGSPLLMNLCFCSRKGFPREKVSVKPKHTAHLRCGFIKSWSGGL